MGGLPTPAASAGPETAGGFFFEVTDPQRGAFRSSGAPLLSSAANGPPLCRAIIHAPSRRTNSEVTSSFNSESEGRRVQLTRETTTPLEPSAERRASSS